MAIVSLYKSDLGSIVSIRFCGLIFASKNGSITLMNSDQKLALTGLWLKPSVEKTKPSTIPPPLCDFDFVEN